MSEETLQEKDEQAFYDSTCFWNQLRIPPKTVWPAWDIVVAFVLCVAAALFIHFMIPAKDISGMVQDLLLPMMGITATLIAFVFAGLVFFVSFHADDEYILCLGRNAPDVYSKFLFLFRWNAAAGITVLIAGLFVYMASYSSGFSGEITGWLYLVVLFLFFYTILSVGTLFGTLARHGMYKLRTYIEWEKEEDGAEPEAVRKPELKSEENFLDSSLLQRFREEIEDHYNIIHNVYESWDQWNLFCAVADRIEDCIRIEDCLNKQAELPKGIKFVIFLVYSCMICDAIQQIFSAFRDFEKQNNVSLSPYKFAESNQYFKEDIQKQVNDNTKKITDDEFLKYIRALVFAHPFETSRSRILQKGERQYSPFIVDKNSLLENKNNIGILIYSNRYSGSKILQFPFPVLKEYIQSRYLLLNDVIENLKKITEVKEYEWKQHKVNRELPPIDILNDIIQILDERYIWKDRIVRAKDFLLCKITKNENENIVQEYREKILSIIPSLCDAVDDLDYEKMEDILSDILYSQAEENPDEKGINYYIEKFRGDSEQWPYIANFVEEWAKKRGVVIEAKEMEKIEIDLLITVVCYFEKESKPQTPQNAERMRKPVCLVSADFRIPRQQPDFVCSIRYPDGTYIKYEKGHRPIVAGTAPPGWEPANEDEAQEIDPVPPEYRARHPQEEGESEGGDRTKE